MPLQIASSPEAAKPKGELNLSEKQEKAISKAVAFSKEVSRMLKDQGLPDVVTPSEFPSLAGTDITNMAPEWLNQKQAEFVSAAGYVNNRLAVIDVQIANQKYQLNIRKANLEVEHAGKKAAEIKEIIRQDSEMQDLEFGKIFLESLKSRFAVYYDLFTNSQAVLSREQTRRSNQYFHRGP